LLNYIDSQWSDLDIDVELVNSSEQHFSSRHWFQGQDKICPIALFGYRARLNSEEEIIMSLLEYSFDKSSLSFEQNKEINQILQRLKTTQNINDRLVIVNEVEKILLDEKLILLVGAIDNNSLVRNHIKNYKKATRRDFIAYSQNLQ
jgi:ABC-type transport system substrate-binding protein